MPRLPALAPNSVWEFIVVNLFHGVAVGADGAFVLALLGAKLLPRDGHGERLSALLAIGHEIV